MPFTFQVLTVVLAALVAQQQDPADPRAIARMALQAVESDSARVVHARWQVRLQRNPGDRAAALGLATLARLTYDYDAATHRYRALAPDSARPDRYAVYARVGLGQALETRGLLTDAQVELTRARAEARALGDAAAEADALITLSLVRAQAEGIELGFALLDSAARRLPAGPATDDSRAELLRRRAVLLAVAGRADAAAKEAAACLAVARRADVLRAEAQCLRSLALNFKLQGEDDSSIAVLRVAEQLQRRAHDRSVLAETLLRRADAQRALGDLGAAKEALQAALVEATVSRNLLAVASANVGLGSLALRVQDYSAADEHLRKAYAMFQAQGDSGGAVIALAFQSYLDIAIGDLASARTRAQEVLRWYQLTGDIAEEFATHRSIAAIEMRAEAWAAAARALDAARDLARRRGSAAWLADLAVDEGRLALERNDLAVAERRFRTYLLSRDSAEHIARHETRMRLAEIYARRGDVVQAEQELASASDELDRWRATLADRELRLLAFQANPTDHLEQSTSAATVIAALVGAGRVTSAFELVERNRARELADRLAQADALRSDSAAAGLVLARARQQARRLSAAEIAAAIPDTQTALIEFVAGSGRAPITAFAVTRAGVTAQVLTTADSAGPLVDRLVAMLESGQDSPPLARAVGAAILDQALAGLDTAITRVVIVPDGPLHRVPFDALLLADGNRVIERYGVSLAPSASVVATLWRRGRRPRAADTAASVLVFGDPTFADEMAPGDASRFRQTAGVEGGLPRLAGSGAEARAVARHAGAAVVLLRDDASEAFLKHAPLDRFDLLHFATHALVDEASLARTALALAPGQGEDGFVTPADLAALRLNAELVVLSACRTAGGVVVAGEGMQGLAAPLLQSGARSVVATQWQVSDRGTVRLVEDFYDALARGLPVVEALRAAKLAALRRGTPAGEWAAFTVLGDPLAAVPLRPSGPRLPRWLPVGTFALLLGAGGYWVSRRRTPA